MKEKKKGRPISLKTIQKHLRKQDRIIANSMQDTGWLSLMGLVGAVVISGLAIVIGQTANDGWNLVGFAAILPFVFIILATLSKKRRG